jgi:transposase-like protein
MKQAPFKRLLTGTVEVDETYVGGKLRRDNKRPIAPPGGSRPNPNRARTGRPGADSNKAPVLALVERDGEVRSFRMANVTGDELKGAIRRNVDKQAHIRTDAFKSYKGLDREFASHEVVNHMDEYVRGDVHTNTAENYFSILKRGIDGVYHHVSEAHLPRYLAEFDFRYNHRVGAGYSDSDRTVAALLGAEGKRLMYSM